MKLHQINKVAVRTAIEISCERCNIDHRDFYDRGMPNKPQSRARKMAFLSIQNRYPELNKYKIGESILGLSKETSRTTIEQARELYDESKSFEYDLRAIDEIIDYLSSRGQRYEFRPPPPDPNDTGRKPFSEFKHFW